MVGTAMSKPENIPQDAWDAAGTAYWICNPRGERAVSHETIARAIMAAKAEEREACAAIAADMSNPYKGGARGVAQEQGRAIAAAIRSRP